MGCITTNSPSDAAHIVIYLILRWTNSISYMPHRLLMQVPTLTEQK